MPLDAPVISTRAMLVSLSEFGYRRAAFQRHPAKDGSLRAMLMARLCSLEEAGILTRRPRPCRMLQPRTSRCSYTERTALEPSPTAAATRLVEPCRTSPTA